ncbi:MAG: DUF4214 domain-containing protein [Clostridiales bacterium]|nr:DUF4214 domain-containing protein [Clostridiales bacterium]
MRSKKSVFSFFIAVVMFLGMIGFSQLTVLADEDTRITNLKVSDDGMLTWDADGEYSFHIYMQVSEHGYVSIYLGNEREYNLIPHYVSNGSQSGEYKVTLSIAVWNETNTSCKSEGSKNVTYYYHSAKETLSTPKNVRVEGDYLVWDASTSGGEKVTDTTISYRYYVNGKSSITGQGYISVSDKTTSNKVALAEIFRQGTCDYHIEIYAEAIGYPTSDRYKDDWKDYSYNCDYISNIKTNTDYKASWNAYPGAESYFVKVTTLDVFSSISVTTASTEWDMSLLLQDPDKTGERSARIDIYALNSDGWPISKATQKEFKYQGYGYPLKLYGKRLSQNWTGSLDDLLGCEAIGLSSRVKYDPKSNTLTFVSFDMQEYIANNPDDEVPTATMFESSADLTVKGDATLLAYGGIFEANESRIIFDKDCNISCESYYQTFVAKDATFNGQSLSFVINLNNSAVCVYEDFTIGENCKSFYASNTQKGDELTPAIICGEDGKITLNGQKIVIPAGGSLGEDPLTIYDKEGKPANEVKLFLPSPTPTKKVSPTPTKKSTPIPTKKASPTPTKKSTPTPTKKVTPAPTKKVTPAPTKRVSPTPTKKVTPDPTKKVTNTPTKAPTKVPTKVPTNNPTKTPTKTPTKAPTKDVSPTVSPTPATPTVTKAPGKPTVTSKPEAPTPTTAPGQPTGKPADPTPTPVKEPSIADFVERLYTIALDRPSEKAGKDFWINEIESGNRTGGDCAHFFLIEAEEFLNRGLSDDDFVETLYRTFFDRASEPAGKAFWVGSLKNGKMTKEDVINGFIDSAEWCNVCATYGVRSGAPHAKAEFASKNAKDFAARLYTCCLNRDPEEKGLEYWALALTNLEQTGCSAAKFFFTGDEFVGFGLKNDEYVRRLYTTFMGRDPESSEINYWVGEIAKGTQTKASVLQFFGSSEEFTKICKRYGIERGSI